MLSVSIASIVDDKCLSMMQCQMPHCYFPREDASAEDPRPVTFKYNITVTPMLDAYAWPTSSTFSLMLHRTWIPTAHPAHSAVCIQSRHKRIFQVSPQAHTLRLPVFMRLVWISRASDDQLHISYIIVNLAVLLCFLSGTLAALATDDEVEDDD